MSRIQVSLGQVVITVGAQSSIPPSEVLLAIGRHSSGDWGDVCEEDWNANNHALENKLRLVSAYHSEEGAKFYVITEWDRSYTTILLPEEY